MTDIATDPELVIEIDSITKTYATGALEVQALKSVAAWTKDALAEHDFLEGNEDYRASR